MKPTNINKSLSECSNLSPYQAKIPQKQVTTFFERKWFGFHRAWAICWCFGKPSRLGQWSLLPVGLGDTFRMSALVVIFTIHSRSADRWICGNIAYVGDGTWNMDFSKWGLEDKVPIGQVHVMCGLHVICLPSKNQHSYWTSQSLIGKSRINHQFP